MRSTLAAVLCLAALAAPITARAADACPQVGQPAPRIALPIGDGTQILALDDLLAKGTPVVVGFWAHHCVPCETELPALQRIADGLAGKLGVLLVHVGPDEDRMKAKATKLGLRLPMASDDSERKSKRYCVTALPRTFLVDKGGVVRAIFSDTTTFAADLERELAKLGVKRSGG